MRFILYNIRYGTGGGFRLPWAGYLRRTSGNLSDISSYIQAFEPHIVGLVEVDAGSFRCSAENQAETIADDLGHYHSYMSKYHDESLMHRIPVLNRQGNAFLTHSTIANEKFHYFDQGVKRLVIELELEHVTLFLVHLALKFRTRHNQLQQLYKLVKETKKPHIVAGDFNPLRNDSEIELFQAATGLRNANKEGIPTFPSWAPKRQLDFIFYSSGIEVTQFKVPSVTYSDHLPLICDFDVVA
jgi:endonuclease/exonuclease/phosphatase family metal-dependent hydrolase